MREFPGGPELLIKREDLCRTAARGCKARKLVALMADAQSIPTTFILTTGSGQSNYCAMTAVAAAMYGMRTELHLAGRDPGPRTRHLCIAVPRRGDGQVHRRATWQQRRVGDASPRHRVPGSWRSALRHPARRVHAPGRSHLRRCRTRAPDPARPSGANAPGDRGRLVRDDGRPDPQDLGGWPGLPSARLQRALAGAGSHAPPGAAAGNPRREYFPATGARPSNCLDGSQPDAGCGISTRAGQRPGRLAAHSDATLLDSTCTAKAMAGPLQGIAADTYRRGDRVVFHTPAGSAACSPELAPQTCATRH